MAKTRETRKKFSNGVLRRDSLALTLKTVSLTGWAKIAIFAGLLFMVYFSALGQLVMREWQNEDYSYCQLIPLVALYLIYERRNKFTSGRTNLNWLGLLPLGLGVSLFWAGEFAGAYFFLYISLWFVILGLFWTQFGWQNLKIVWFAFIVLLAAFPLPSFLNMKVTFWLKLLSSQIGVSLLQFWGMSAYREGNVIDLGFTQLQVVDACSGLRYVFPLMLLSLLLAYHFRAQLWKRWVLFLSSIPISIFVNSFRIAATGLLYSWLGAKAAEGFFHGFSGWLIFILTLPFLILEMYVLRKLPRREIQKHVEVERAAEVSDRPPADSIDGYPTVYQKAVEKARSRRILLSSISVILILTAVLPRALDLKEHIPNRRNLNTFPLHLGDYSGRHQVIESAFLNILKLSDYVQIDYRDAQSKELNFYIAYYESQLKGEGIHLPDSCLPGSGWYFSESGTKNIRLPGGRVLRVNRIIMEKGGVRELSYYWFPQRGRTFSSVFELRLYTFWDAITRRRSDGALLRLITPIYGGESVDNAEGRLHNFVLQIDPIITEYIPK